MNRVGVLVSAFRILCFWLYSVTVAPVGGGAYRDYYYWESLRCFDHVHDVD
jgi:hypothetical protein